MSLVEPQDMADQPPKPPQIPRKLLFYRVQAIGVPLIAILPLLAIFKVFDTSAVTAETAGTSLRMEVTYPNKFRYKTYEPLEILVQNAGNSDLQNVEVGISRDYVQSFVDVTFEPDITEIDSQHYIVRIEQIPAGQARKVTMDMKADQAGTAKGEVFAKSATEELKAPIGTFVYP